MVTDHRLIIDDARRMRAVADGSVHLVVTSPPYPMIEMWDDLFRARDPEVARCLARADGPGAFERMHRLLDPVWAELVRVLAPGGFACINIGDATRTVADEFRLYTNHTRIATRLQALGLGALPAIVWRKQTNAPNKFMGSGMLPAGAYVTLEHEYVLVFRKGGKRRFARPADKARRMESALFWEERNQWFSDVWFDLKGARQQLADAAARRRSGAFPLELAYRLINMYALKGDTVLDPFCGTGTTLAAAMVAGRNSIGYECEGSLAGVFAEAAARLTPLGRQMVDDRLQRHRRFVAERRQAGKPLRHRNRWYGFAVVTAQEKTLYLNPLELIRPTGGNRFEAVYAPLPDQPAPAPGEEPVPDPTGPAPREAGRAPAQLPLLP